MAIFAVSIDSDWDSCPPYFRCDISDFDEPIRNSKKALSLSKAHTVYSASPEYYDFLDENLNTVELRNVSESVWLRPDLVVHSSGSAYLVWEAKHSGDTLRVDLGYPVKFLKPGDSILEQKAMALESILNLINTDKDGGFFICEEASAEIEAARRLFD